MSRALPVVEKRDVLLPGQAGQHQQSAFGRQIQQPPWRHGVDPHRVYAGVNHHPEIPIDGIGSLILGAIVQGMKWAVGDPPHVQLLIAAPQEFPAGGRPDLRRRLP